MKKVFIASVILLGITLIFLGVYNFAFRNRKTETLAPIVEQKNPMPAEESIRVPEKITAISGEAALGPFFDKQSETITYYSKNEGTVWKVSYDGRSKQQLSTAEVKGLRNVLWSPDHTRVLTTIEKEGKNIFYEYDYNAKKGVQLKDGLDTAVWDNVGTKIFYKYYDTKTQKRSLNIANPDGSDWQKIADVDFRNVSIAPIPLSSQVSFWNYPDAGEETSLNAVGFAGGETKALLKGKYGADYLWSPDGTRALVSALPNKDSKMTTLGIVTLSGEYSDLGIPTLASKCVWSMDSKTVYYALPGEIPETAVMPNDYQDNRFNTDDTFWKIDIATNKKNRVIEASNIPGKFDSKNLFLSATEDALYFINRIDGKLYRLDF